MGAIGGFSAYAYALKHLPVATVSLYAYINPIIAVVLGTLVLSEPFDIRMLLAAAVVFVGIVLVRSTRKFGNQNPDFRCSIEERSHLKSEFCNLKSHVV